MRNATDATTGGWWKMCLARIVGQGGYRFEEGALMKRWEYCVLLIDNLSQKGWYKLLGTEGAKEDRPVEKGQLWATIARLGEDGWELVSNTQEWAGYGESNRTMTYFPAALTYTFKRELQEGE